MPYADTAYANTYHNTRLSKEAWGLLSPETQAAALESATDAINLYARTKGGWLKDYTENTPDDIKNACCREALALSDTTTQERIKAQAQGVTATSMGSASESYNGAAGGTLAVLADPGIALLLAPYLKQSGGGVAIL
jgi:hypothetical protein